jgi:hypothetical protein
MDAMIPLETVRHETFAPLIGMALVAMTANGRIELRLAEAKLLGHKRDEATRDPFSLTFRGVQGLRLTQGTYPIICEALGEIQIFITQVADGAKGSEFEAIFT